MIPSAAHIPPAILLKLSLLVTDEEHVHMGNIEYFDEMRGNLLWVLLQ
jgi:hypothetical protein